MRDATTDRVHEVWIVMRQYGPDGEEPEAAFFARRDLEAWVKATGGWENRYYCACQIPKLVLPEEAARS